MQINPKVYKIGVNIPAEFLDDLMEAVDSAMSPLYPGYDHAYMYWPVKGTWRPLEGSNPYLGTVGKIEVADEMRLEFAVKSDDVKKVIETIVRIHPYEEPAIDVIEMTGWKDFIASDDS